MSEQTYTEAELKAAVDRAVAEATSELQQKAQLEAAVSAAKAEAEEQVKDLQAKLDAAVLEATSEREKRESIEKAQKEAEEKAAREAEIAARRDERLAQIREVANFPEEYLTANSDRFAGMADEDFAKALDDWRAIAARTDAPPAKTALKAGREEAPKNGSALHEVLSLRGQGIDPRKL